MDINDLMGWLIANGMELILYYLKHVKEASEKQKVDDIIRYIVHPEYQKLHGDYGWHWAAKTYHASSPGIYLPFYDDAELIGNQTYYFMSMLDKMSYSPIMCKAQWFQKSIDYLEQFKTERGTYCLTIELIHPLNMNLFYSLYVSKETLSKTKRNDIKSLAIELYSTFFVLMMKKRMEIL